MWLRLTEESGGGWPEAASRGGNLAIWGETLGIDPDSIRMQRKSNSNQLTGRTWRSRHGVLAVGVGDTLLRARLQAWMDRLRSEWQ